MAISKYHVHKFSNGCGVQYIKSGHACSGSECRMGYQDGGIAMFSWCQGFPSAYIADPQPDLDVEFMGGMCVYESRPERRGGQS